MDRNMNRSNYYRQGGLKGVRPPRLTPSEPPHHHTHSPHSPPTPPPHSTPHDDLIHYIYESWDKISREARVWEPPRHMPPQRPPLPPIDLDSWYGRRLHNNHHTPTHIKHNS